MWVYNLWVVNHWELIKILEDNNSWKSIIASLHGKQKWNLFVLDFSLF